MISITQYYFIGGTGRSSCSCSSGSRLTHRTFGTPLHPGFLHLTYILCKQCPVSSARTAVDGIGAVGPCVFFTACSASMPYDGRPSFATLFSRIKLSATSILNWGRGSWLFPQCCSHQHLGDTAAMTARATGRWSGRSIDDSLSSTGLASGTTQAASRAGQLLPWTGCTSLRSMDSRF